MMADFHVERGYGERETDLFIAGAVLQLVCLKKHIVAAIALDAFAQKHPEITRWEWDFKPDLKLQSLSVKNDL